MDVWNDGFAPIIDENSKILILGSFPSVKSRQVGFYYGNPQNKFWKNLGIVFGTSVPLETEEKIRFLKERRVALWDVYIKCNIKGSGDSDINSKTAKESDLKGLLVAFPNITTVVCNGKKAYEVAAEALNDLPVKVVCFSSTSPANPRFDEKEWVSGLREFLIDKV